jgi:hypothetical protein
MTHIESMSRKFADPRLRVFIALVVAAGSFASERIYAQDKPVADQPLIAVEVRGAPGNVTDTVRITGFRVDGVTYDLAYAAPPRFDGAPRFDTKPDWYERLEIVAQNKSNKTVVAAYLQVECVPPGQGQWPAGSFVIPVHVGREPDRFVYARAPPSTPHRIPEEAPIAISPGKQFVIALKDLPARAFSDARKNDPPTACTLDLQFVHFSDGTMWATGGQFFKPNPDSEYGYIKATPEEFGMKLPMQ